MEINESDFLENLTEKKYDYNPLIGRECELRTLGTLLMDDEKSIIIYGKPGVGKTTLVNGLAYQIQNGLINERLKNKKIYSMSAAEMISGTKLRGEFEERLLYIIKRLVEIDNCILFIDEFHSLIGLGNTMEHYTNDAAQILKPYLGDGRIKIIGGTTEEEYEKFINGTKSDMTFSRRFIGLKITELDNESLTLLIEEFIKKCQLINYIGLDFKESDKVEIIKLLLELSSVEYKNPKRMLYNPDFALTILRFCYDFAKYDGKRKVDLESLKEGLEFTIKSGYLSFEGENFIAEKIKVLTKL